MKRKGPSQDAFPSSRLGSTGSTKQRGSLQSISAPIEHSPAKALLWLQENFPQLFTTHNTVSPTRVLLINGALSAEYRALTQLFPESQVVQVQGDRAKAVSLVRSLQSDGKETLLPEPDSKEMKRLLNNFFPSLFELAASPDLSSPNSFDVIFLFPSKFHRENELSLQFAASLLNETGSLFIAGTNNSGIKRYQSFVHDHFEHFENHSKHKCRIIVGQNLKKCAGSLPELENFFSPVKGSNNLTSLPGVFAADACDKGSLLLIQSLAELPRLRGVGMDLGCGYGILGYEILRTSPDVTHLSCVDSSWAAVLSAKRNLEPWGDKASFHWRDIAGEELSLRADFVVMNPPFHIGQESVPRLGQIFIEKAANCLSQVGVLTLVANRTLPYEGVLAAHFQKWNKWKEINGFKILRAERPLHL